MPRSIEAYVPINTIQPDESFGNDSLIEEQTEGCSVFQMEEPDDEEMARIRLHELLSGDEYDQAALAFAYSLEALSGNNPDTELNASHYLPVQRIEVRDDRGILYYVRYATDLNSPSLGLLMTRL